jgi:ferric-dicitrate binding protein FerR (iron transport regulator)
MHNHYSYRNFTEEQFAADERFQQWVLNPDKDSDALWQAFLEEYPDQLAVVGKARHLVEDLTYSAYNLQPLSREEKTSLKDNIFRELDLPMSEPAPIKAKIRKLHIARAAAAVVTVATLSIYLLFRGKSGNTEHTRTPLLAEHTGMGEMKKITLPDSTQVILNANSTLTYENNFSSTHDREVVLTGNAFFQVRKNPGLTPFIVHTGSLSVTVLGTEFNVNARSQNPEVSLTSGKVKLIDATKTNDPVYLLPGDKVKLDTASHSFTRSFMDTRLYAAWTDGMWNFRNNSLEEITGLIGEYYGVDIEFRNEKNKYKRIDAVIAVGSLQKLVPVLAQTIHTKMSLSANKLIIE